MNRSFQKRNPGLIVSLLIALTLITQACVLDSNSSNTTLRDVTGTLIWSGSPVQDGAGILFETADTTYGAPGVKSDYSDYFTDDESRVQVRADIRITGDTVVRGWGAEFPEIEFLDITHE